MLGLGKFRSISTLQATVACGIFFRLGATEYQAHTVLGAASLTDQAAVYPTALVAVNFTALVAGYLVGKVADFPMGLNADAQNSLGVRHANGQGIPHNVILAHMWFNISAANGDRSGAENRLQI